MDHLLLSLLNLTADDVQDIKSLSSDGSVSYYVTLSRQGISGCEKCDSTRIVGNGYLSRKITLSQDALDHSCVYLKIPRVRCKDCGHSMSADYHIAPKNSSLSYQTIIKIMELLKNPGNTFKSVAQQLSIPSSTVSRVFDKYCHIPSVDFPEVICVDEVYSKNSDFDSKYICVFYDFFRHTVVDVLPSRQKNYLHLYFQKIDIKDLEKVKFVCMDMYRPYKDIVRFYFKKAAICVDSFHVIKLLNDCLSKARINVMKRYETDSLEYYLLKRFNFLLFDNSVNLDGKPKFNKKLNKYINYRGLLNLLLSIDGDLHKAFVLKQHYSSFNRDCSAELAAESLNQLIDEFTAANVSEMIPFLTAITNWKKEIVNSFSLYKGRRINSGVAESTNAIISRLLYNTKGIRNVERRKKRIMYSVNKTGFLI